MNRITPLRPNPTPAATGSSEELRRKAEDQIRRLKRTYAMLSDVNQVIVRRYAPEEILARACRVAVERGGFLLAWIGLVDPATGRIGLVAHGGVSPETLAVLERVFGDPALGCAFTAQTLRTGTATACNDVAVNPLSVPWRHLALERNYQSLVSLPILDSGQAVGVFNLYAGEPGFFDPDEVSLLNELAIEISFAREMARREAERKALETRTSRQRDALIRHTGRKDPPDEGLDAALRRQTECSADTLETARVSVWLYDAEQSRLECRELFTLATREHTAGMQLAARDYPEYFRALAAGEVMAADDACHDPRTREFTASYFQPLGIGALLDVPIHRGGKIVGVLCHEHVGGVRTWTSDEKTFAVAMANLMSLALEGEDRRVLQQQFLRAQRMEAIGTLAGGLAHDLNNILAPMLMAAGLLQTKLTSERDRNMIAMIESGAQRGTDIIRQLLTFGRGLGGARTTVQVRHLVKDLTHIVRETFPRNIAYEHRVPATLWPLHADATQLHQVLLNLIVNARDAMPSGGRLTLHAENVTLEVDSPVLPASAPPGPYVKLTVVDTGEGIPPAIIGRIFEPFFTTKPVGKGTGLGLPSVLSIVNDHGGFLKFASQPGVGTTFDVYLPALQASEPPATSPETREMPRGSGELVLLVDDEAPMREATREMLELHGYRVVTAVNGEAAVRLFIEQRGAVQLVLTDVDMPVMGGIELIRSLRIVGNDLRFVVLAGSGTVERNEELKQLGIEHCLEKPCNAARILQTLRRALES
jgi:signal transduction histidine kinase/ActR/RegA family two-component response regulator